MVLLERSSQYLFFSRLFQRGEIDFLLKSEIYKLSDLVVKQCYFNITVKKNIPSKVWKYEDEYRGREFPGFTNYRTFEDIIKEQIIELEEPAVVILNNVIGMSHRPHEAVAWELLVCLTLFFPG